MSLGKERSLKKYLCAAAGVASSAEESDHVHLLVDHLQDLLYSSPNLSVLEADAIWTQLNRLAEAAL